VYLARATSKRAVKLEEEVVVLGVDAMGFGFNGRERLCATKEGKGKTDCIWGRTSSCPGAQKPLVIASSFPIRMFAISGTDPPK